MVLQRVCIQRSGSIVQNGAAVFSPLDQDAGSVQRYRLHGSLTLPLFNMFQAPIVFGAMVLDAFEQIVVDGTTKRTGIQNALLKPSLSPSVANGGNGGNEAAFATCMRPVRCVGQQQYLPRLNACQGKAQSPALPLSMHRSHLLLWPQTRIARSIFSTHSIQRPSNAPSYVPLLSSLISLVVWGSNDFTIVCLFPNHNVYFFDQFQHCQDGSWIVAVVVTMTAFLAVEALFSLSIRHLVRKTRLNSLSQG